MSEPTSPLPQWPAALPPLCLIGAEAHSPYLSQKFKELLLCFYARVRVYI